MCLAKAYFSGEKDLLMEDISSLKIDGEKIYLRTLFGEQKEVEGIVKEVDFQNARIILQMKGK